MSKLPLITVPNPLLRQKSKAVEPTNPEVRSFINDMTDVLVKKSDPPGVGLSAVQVGKLWRILLLYLPKDYQGEDAPHESHDYVLTTIINPIITAQSKETTLGPNTKKPLLEGCLSIPHLYGPVYRPTWIDVEFSTYNLSPNGGPMDSSLVRGQKQRFSGFSARVFLHEYDHFEGVLFTDYTLSQKQPLFFDTGDDFELVQNPKAILTW